MINEDKEFWDEVLRGLDPEYTSEAEEFLAERRKKQRSPLRVVLLFLAVIMAATAAAVLIFKAMENTRGVSLPDGAHFPTMSGAEQNVSLDSGSALLNEPVFVEKTGRRSIDSDQTEIPYEYIYNDRGLNFEIYEDVFFGEWLPEKALEEPISVNYSENMFGQTSLVMCEKSVFADDSGYYISGNAYDDYVLFYIPLDNTDYMYGYKRDNEYGRNKNEYYASWRRDTTAKLPGKTLVSGMKLDHIAIEKLCQDLRDKSLLDALTGSFTDKDGHKCRSVLCSVDERCDVYLTEYDPQGLICVSSEFRKSSDRDNTYRMTIELSKGLDGWNYRIATGDGKVYGYDNTLRFSLDRVPIYKESFIGVWENIADPSDTFTLSFDEDIFTDIYGFCETDGVMFTSAETERYGALKKVWLYISESDPDTMRISPAGRKNEPFVTYKRIAAASDVPPIRGEFNEAALSELSRRLSKYKGLGSLITAIDDVRYYKTVADERGKRWISRADAEKDKVYITGAIGAEVRVLMRFYSEDSFDDGGELISTPESRYLEAVFTVRGVDKPWELESVSNTINSTDFTYTGDKIPADNGYYFILDNYADFRGDNVTLGSPGEGAEKTIYYYDNTDGLYYRIIYVKGFKELVAVSDKNNLYFMTKTFSAGRELIETFVSFNGERAYIGGIETPSDDSNILVPVAMYFSGGYLISEYTENGESRYLLHDPYGDCQLSTLMRTDYLKMDENGFTIRKNGELKYYDTTGESLEGIYPLLLARYRSVSLALQMEKCMRRAGGMFKEEIDGKKVELMHSPLAPDYASFDEWLKTAMTDDKAESAFESSMYIEHNGALYGKFGILPVADEGEPLVLTRELKYIDSTHAIATLDAYMMSYDNYLKDKSVKPDETFTLELVKTENGWRFDSNYYPEY